MRKQSIVVGGMDGKRKDGSRLNNQSLEKLPPLSQKYDGNGGEARRDYPLTYLPPPHR